MDGGSAEAVELPDRECVAFAKVLKHRCEPGPMALGAGEAVVAIDTDTARIAQGIELERFALIFIGDANIADLPAWRVVCLSLGPAWGGGFHLSSLMSRCRATRGDFLAGSGLHKGVPFAARQRAMMDDPVSAGFLVDNKRAKRTEPVPSQP